MSRASRTTGTTRPRSVSVAMPTLHEVCSTISLASESNDAFNMRCSRHVSTSARTTIGSGVTRSPVRL